DGDPDPSVCDGTSGTPVDTSTIRSYILGTKDADAAGDALIMGIDLGTDADPTAGWEPSTTYLIKFAHGAAVTPLQGGASLALPGSKDFSLCFHTTKAE